MEPKNDLTDEGIRLIRRVALVAKPHDWSTRAQVVAALRRCHMGGCPLRLAAMLTAPDEELERDVAGIMAHSDEATGELRDGFWPRFALNERGV